ncbi:HlyD family secretion protein [Rhodopila globiformis]|uniref:Hemolysin D n=1 Tax=Rhodopila globiformis TaxID=1071 RepID=A0A2S6NMF4_RHOGL|nr:HlyD family secretion protein [Rhodopila globiformis]PPQ37112.1 hemolysin D [Rhodopila globiformis]
MDQHVAHMEAEQDRRSGRPFDRKAAIRAGRRRLARTLLIAVGAVALLGAAAWYGHYWWTTGQFLVSTDDAYLQADNVIISPKISGYIAKVLVQDNQPVRAGDVLARIDDRDYLTALAVARANVDAEKANINNLMQQVAQQQLVMTQAHATVTADDAALTFAKQDYDRYASLSRTGAGTIQRAQQATSEIREKQAALDRDVIAVAVAQKQVDVLNSQISKARATLALQDAALRQAQLNVSYTMITAPISGTVGARTLRVGQYVQAGTQLMAVVPLQAVYVVANYKETQLTDVRAGQPVTIEVDTFPDATVHGEVNSIAPASGQEFALLPPDNATGNFTKIVQRVPVKITIDPKDPLIGRLRPGMSVEPTIDTHPHGS